MEKTLVDGKLAVMLTFDVDGEAVWVSRDPESSHLPVYLSNGTYGPKVGLKRVLDVLDRYDVKGTFFVPGWTIELHKRQIAEIVERSHELAHHMYKHEYPFKINNEEKEREVIQKASENIKELTGKFPVGFRAPGEHSPYTLKIVQELGFLYTSSCIGQETPYIHPST